jgi:Na+-driven multidrug efflux pump
VGVFTAALALLGARPFLQGLNAPADVLPLATGFLMMLAPALLLDAWNAALSSVMRAHLRVRDSFVVIVGMQSVQLLLALLLMPRWGLAGFAAALACSRALGLALHLLFWRKRLGLRLQAHDWWHLPRAELAAILRIGAPGAAENIAYRLAFMVSLSVVGAMGVQALATHAYATQISFFAMLFGVATGLGVEIVVGHLVGAARLHEAHALVLRALGIGLAISGVGTVAVALAGPQLMRVFTQDTAIITMGVSLLWWTVLLEPGRTFNLIVINALRAAGDARFPVQAGALSMLVILAGGSWLLGHVMGLGLVGVWIAYAADEWLRGLIMWRRWASRAWVPQARRARQRLSR